MIFSNDYAGTLDRGFLEASNSLEEPITAGAPMSKMSPYQVGTSSNPFQHPLQALQARIREGGNKVEIVFFGAGKGNRERFTPESISKPERQDIRELAKVTGVTTTVHATPAVSGLAGFTQNGFDEQQREQALKELRKAIEFSADATTGGAVVVHTGEWMRPISESHGKEGFRGYEEEPNKAPLYVVDTETGQLMGIRKDHTVYEPEFETAKDRGMTTDIDGKQLRPDDWVDINGQYIPKGDINRMFDRVPKWNKEETNFKVQKVDFETFKKRAEEYKSETGEDIKPEVLFYRTQLQNQILQAKGNSLYHAQQYEELKFARDKIGEALRFYEQLDRRLSDEEKRKLLIDRHPHVRNLQYTTPIKEGIAESLRREKKETEDRMRHIHETSASADVQARELQERVERIKPIDEYGIQKSADSLARAGLYAFQKTKGNPHLKEPIYISPENWDPREWAAHPDEAIKLVNEGRTALAKMLTQQYGISEEEAKKKAAQHIKSTIDTGHMNMWRQYFERRPGESEETFDKRYRAWYKGKVEDLAKSGTIGHVHLTDNFGYDDEHLTIGQGNTPMKEFIEVMEKEGITDMIVEPGSFNPFSALPESWQFLGSPMYMVGHPMQRNWGSFHKQHFGYEAPPFYVVGAYSPSNEMRIWSEVPLE